MKLKCISLLGSTGSIGTSTLEVARHLGSSKIQVTALAAKSNIDLLEKQAQEFHPELIAVYDKNQALILQKRLPHIPVLGGMEGLCAVAEHPSADTVVSAISGTLGLLPTISAIKAKKYLALANKEALVSGGSLVMNLADQNCVNIIPIDSEHSALFQCLNGEKTSTINRLIITASGGPFRQYTKDQLQNISVDQALNHPTWKMGPKITIDSSTLMNKGFEIIEAHWLFGIPRERIEVVIHPQSIIHSLVEFNDYSMMAQMSYPSMKLPIQYALTYPERFPGCTIPFDFKQICNLQFFPPDTEKFPCLDLAFAAIEKGGSFPCYMNAANEVLVYRFIEKEFSWIDISRKLEKLMHRHQVNPITSIDDIIGVDTLAREEAARA